jgi:phosphoglycolate phosphatase
VNLIFDLDGTLIDSRLRLYHLFQQLVPASKLSHESYWAFKQDKVSNENILASEFGFDAAAIERFVADWLERIEAPEFLALDKNFPCMHEALDRLSKRARLHVCTARQHLQPAVDQLDRLGLLPYFDSVMVTEQSRGKEELIASVSSLGPQDWILGDTGKDIQVGQALGIKTCAVLSGFLSEKSLRPYGPDLILPAAADFRLLDDLG